MSKVLVEVEPTLWGRVRARALEEGVKVEVVVGRALRGELAGRYDDGSVGRVTGEQPPAADAARAVDLSTAEERTTGIDALRRAVERVAPGTVVSPVAVPDPLVVSPREAERRRRAAQDRLRTHPEDASQDPTDDGSGAGF